jgi:hypothetical protein
LGQGDQLGQRLGQPPVVLDQRLDSSPVVTAGKRGQWAGGQGVGQDGRPAAAFPELPDGGGVGVPQQRGQVLGVSRHQPARRAGHHQRGVRRPEIDQLGGEGLLDHGPPAVHRLPEPLGGGAVGKLVLAGERRHGCGDRRRLQPSVGRGRQGLAGEAAGEGGQQLLPAGAGERGGDGVEHAQIVERADQEEGQNARHLHLPPGHQATTPDPGHAGLGRGQCRRAWSRRGGPRRVGS